jgi:hypothetical protein
LGEIRSGGIRGGIERLIGAEVVRNYVLVKFSGKDVLQLREVGELFSWDKDSVTKLEHPTDPNRVLFCDLAEQLVEYIGGRDETQLRLYNTNNLDLGSLHTLLERHAKSRGSEMSDINGWDTIQARLAKVTR